MNTHLERDIQRDIHLALGATPGVRLFRNNTGLGWVGRVVERRGNTLTLADPRPLHAGLHAGSADLVGWQSVLITPDMVGHRVAVLLSVECKSASGRASDAQRNWCEQVRLAGGRAVIARSVDEARAALL